ncbi:MAG: ABC transporter permease [Clostridiales bacterium]|nr:ABC transporter permease [Clostridiales bacterium]MCD7828010.1 ABC transporter permease [Clostridiales bacterium]
MNNLRKRTRIAMTAPFSVWMAIFVIIPIGLVLYYALTDSEGSFTLSNIASIWEYKGTYLISLELAFVATVLCLILAYPLAYIISRMKTHSQNTMVMLVMLPMWMNFLIRTYAWMTILEDTGLINTVIKAFLSLFGYEFEGFSMINTNGAIILGMVYNFLPYMVLPIYTCLTKIDNKLIEAARDLGANSLNVFTKVILPQSMPGIISGITMVFVPAVSTFVISKLLGGGMTYLIGDIIENYFLGNTGEVNYNVGAALSLVLMILILISTGIMNHFDDDAKESGGGLI